MVLKLRKFDPVAKAIKYDLKWLFPHVLGEFKTLCVMYKLIKHDRVPIFKGYFIRANSIHDHGTRLSDNFRSVIKPKTEFVNRSFQYRGIVLWNALPDHLKSEQSYAIFKNKLKVFMLQKKL